MTHRCASRLSLLLGVMAIVACVGNGDRGAVIGETRGDTANADALDSVDSDAAATDEAITGGDGQDTIAVTAEPPSCHVDPVLQYDEVIVGDGVGLHGFPVADSRVDVESRRLATWGDDEAPVHVIGAPRAVGGVELAVTLQSATGPCTLVGYDRQGSEVWRHPSESPTCLPPYVDDLVVLWPTPNASLGWLVLDRDTGARLDTVMFGAAPTTGIITLEPNDPLSGGGGSHWLVGTDAGVHHVERTSAGAYLAAGPLSQGSNAVTALALLESGLVLATLRDFPEDTGFGSFLQVLAVSWSATGVPALAPDSDRITAPGPLASAPIGTGRCGVAGGGGSHWWCPRGAVVAGGEGWLRVWSTRGAQRAAVDEPGTWTHLAMTAGGGVVGVRIGDDGGYGYVAYDPEFDAVETLVEPDASIRACAGAPLVNGVGQLAAHRGPLGEAAKLIRVDRDVAGLATGWPRPGGDARNQQVRLSDPQQCADGFRRFLASIPVAGLAPSALADTTDRYIVGGETPDGGPWLGWFDRGGQLQVGGSLPGPGSPSGPVVALATRPGAVGTLVFLDRRVAGLRSATLQALATDTLTPAWSLTIEGAGFSAAVGMAYDPVADAAFLLAASDSGEGALVVKVDLATQLEVGPGWREPVGTEPTAIVSNPLGGVVIAGSGEDLDGQHAWITALNTDLTSPWRRTVPLVGDKAPAVRLTSREDGGVWAIVTQEDSDSPRYTTTLHPFSASGVPGLVIPVGDDRVLLFAADPAGDALSADVDFGLRPITRALGVAASSDPFAGSRGLVPAALHALGGGAYLLVGERGLAAEAVLLRVGPHGRASCDAVGRCVWVEPSSCTDADTCTTDSCVPTTGLCENLSSIELCLPP
ncbi:MAG: hypothetical protein ACI9MR_002488 [Myxococcota bacterium]|jgi:hypothetical protein